MVARIKRHLRGGLEQRGKYISDACAFVLPDGSDQNAEHGAGAKANGGAKDDDSLQEFLRSKRFSTAWRAI